MAHPPIDSQITFLYTDDLAQTAQFYEEVMGLQLKLDQGACRIYQVSRDGYLGFCRRSAASPSSQEPTHVILTIVTSDVDGWHRHLLEHGVSDSHREVGRRLGLGRIVRLAGTAHGKLCHSHGVDPVKLASDARIGPLDATQSGANVPQTLFGECPLRFGHWSHSSWPLLQACYSGFSAALALVSPDRYRAQSSRTAGLNLVHDR